MDCFSLLMMKNNPFFILLSQIMTIAVNTRFLLKDRLEGIGWFTYQTLQKIVAWYPNDQFIFFFDRPFDEKFVFADNVKPVVLFPPARHPFLFYLWFEYAVTRALKKYKADLFISTDGFLSLSTNVPTLLVIHDLAHVHFPNQVKYLEQKYYNHFMLKFAQKAARIATVSAYSKQDIHQQYHIPLDKIDVVYNGVRVEFKPLSAIEKSGTKAKYADGQDYFFYIGAVHPRKNVHRLIAAFDLFKQATNASLKLLIAGRFAWQTGLVKTAFENATFKKDIHFLNYVPDEEVPLLMGGAIAFVYVSLFEGFGIPLLEAMHCEIPIITSEVSSMPEVVGKAGITVNPNEVEAIKKGMLEVYQNPEKRSELILMARKQRLKFSWEQTARKMEKSIHKILNTT
jgi:glycosyltransferase involved in cell wall biosynthesis